ncbi:hypothetical protein [Parasedimentitalea huanghaiensis]|uniref:Uncharacterized protein n=1 Tax=Parasedimentitalea huanghaiensis TaxID=2682100 RepID=A0A6L6WQH9_9RHOB|nr:hypothetical protein [Zongyanglinia huanghaiensis]MVO17802.1 hypothetical protein [Zongyanglinia huanghaiensis]
MKGWSIFAHSVGMVTRNLSEAMKIALVPVLIGFGLFAALLLITGLTFDTFNTQGSVELLVRDVGVGARLLPILSFLILFVVIQLWIFVSWHRFILLEEYPSGWIPEFRIDRIVAYFGSGLLIGLVVVVSMLPLGMIVGVAAAGFSSALPMVAQFIPLVTMTLAYLIFYRLSPVLPAAAVGDSLKLGEAWVFTAGASGPLLVTGISTAVVQFLLQYVAGLSMVVFPPFGIAFQLLIALVMSLVNVSILTTIYGHYVEEREID